VTLGVIIFVAYVAEALEAARGKKTKAWKLLGYNDRFAFSRNVRRILEKYPHLANEFPTVRTSYAVASSPKEKRNAKRR
jgi:hypothetical protein